MAIPSARMRTPDPFVGSARNCDTLCLFVIGTQPHALKRLQGADTDAPIGVRHRIVTRRITALMLWVPHRAISATAAAARCATLPRSAGRVPWQLVGAAK